MAAALKRDIVVLGLGLMGSALTRRLLHLSRDQTFGIDRVGVWNRSTEKTKPFAEEGAVVFNSVADVFKGTGPQSVIACMFSSYEQTKEVLLSADIREHVRNRQIWCLCSGTPDGARDIDGALREAGVDFYLDACYAGSPHVFQDGKGVFMASPSSAQHAEYTDEDSFTRRVAGALGAKVVFTDAMGSNKAVDYAIVDFFFYNYICFLNGLSMLENEKVAPEVLLDLMRYRLPMFTDQFQRTLPKMDKKEYTENVIASLGTWSSFFGGRVGYLENNNLPTELSTFCEGLCKKAVDEGHGGLAGDFTRLQERLRFAQKKE